MIEATVLVGRAGRLARTEQMNDGYTKSFFSNGLIKTVGYEMV